MSSARQTTPAASSASAGAGSGLRDGRARATASRARSRRGRGRRSTSTTCRTSSGAIRRGRRSAGRAVSASSVAPTGSDAPPARAITPFGPTITPGRREAVHGEQRGRRRERGAEQDRAAVAGATARHREAGGDDGRGAGGDHDGEEVRLGGELDGVAPEQGHREHGHGRRERARRRWPSRSAITPGVGSSLRVSANRRPGVRAGCAWPAVYVAACRAASRAREPALEQHVERPSGSAPRPATRSPAR